MTRLVEREEGKVDTKHVVKVFGMSTWHDELSLTEREAGLKGRLELDLQL